MYQNQGLTVLDGHPVEPTWYAHTLRVAQYGADFNRIQAAVDYADSQGGAWVIEIYPGPGWHAGQNAWGVWNEGDIQSNGGAQITLKGVTGTGFNFHEKVIIAPTVAPAIAVIVNTNSALSIEGLDIIAPDATRPALRVTGPALPSTIGTRVGHCYFWGGAGGNAIEMTGGSLIMRDCQIRQGNVDISTARCEFQTYYCRIIDGNINTAGAFAHDVILINSDFRNSGVISAATGATTASIRGCINVLTLTNAGTGAFEIFNSDIGTVTVSNAAGSMTIRGGYIGACGGSVGSIVWRLDDNHFKVIAGMKNAHALAVVAAGGVIEIGSGTYDEGDLTPGVANVALKGVEGGGTTGGRVRIAPTAAPATAVIVSNLLILNLQDIDVVAPDATRPALRINAGGGVLANLCSFEGVGAGDSIQMVGGAAAFKGCRIQRGDIDLSTAPCSLEMAFCEIVDDPIDTSGAFAHDLTFRQCDFRGRSINSLATGATTLSMRGCSYVGTITNAGTGAFTIRDSEVDTVTTSGAGTITVIGGHLNACGGATAAILWKTGPLRYEVLPGMRIQDSLTAGAGGEVIIHAGTHAPTADLTVSANTLVRGEGQATIVTPTGAAITNGFVLNGDNITLKDMKIILAAGAGAPGTRPNVIYAANRSKLWLSKLWIVGDESVADDGSDGRQNGVYFSTCPYSQIALCHIEDNKRSGVYLSNSDYSIVDANQVKGNTRYGVYFTNTDRSKITNNQIDSNTYPGIHLFASTENSIAENNSVGNNRHGISLVSASTDNTITANTCGSASAGYCGIYVESSNRNTITANPCRANNLHGIYIYRSSYCSVVGNPCSGQVTGDGINITGDGGGNADYNTLTANPCTENASDGIQIAGGANANKNIVTSNPLLGNAGLPLNDGGNLTETGHNIVA